MQHRSVSFSNESALVHLLVYSEEYKYIFIVQDNEGQINLNYVNTLHWNKLKPVKKQLQQFTTKKPSLSVVKQGQQNFIVSMCDNYSVKKD